MSSQRVLIVYGNAKSNGLCRHLVERVIEHLDQRGAQWRFHNLLEDGFDPVLRMGPEQAHAEALTAEEDPLVHRYQQDVLWAEHLVIVQPVWWFAPPAILKGWVDRVLVDGIAVDHSQEPPAGLLGGKKALLVQTFKAPRVVDRLLMRRISTSFWSRAVFFSVGIESTATLALYEVQDLSRRRLERFSRKLSRSLDKLLSVTVA